VNLKLGE